jgi:hypothetical protein
LRKEIGSIADLKDLGKYALTTLSHTGIISGVRFFSRAYPCLGGSYFYKSVYRNNSTIFFQSNYNTQKNLYPLQTDLVYVGGSAVVINDTFAFVANLNDDTSRIITAASGGSKINLINSPIMLYVGVNMLASTLKFIMMNMNAYQ